MIGKKLIELFLDDSVSYDELITIEQREDFTQYEIKATLTKISNIDSLNKFKTTFIQNDIDRSELIIVIGAFDPIIITSNNLDFKDFKEKLTTDIEYKDHNDEIKLKFTIFKKNDQTISIYHLKSFEDYLCSLNLNQLLSTLIENKNSNEQLIFDVIDEEFSSEMKSSTISFSKNTIGENFTDLKNLEKRKNKRNELCHFQNSAHFNFLPEEFNFTYNNQFPQLSILFLKLKIIFSIISIFDISRIEGDQINLTLKGFKSSNVIWNYDEISTISHEDWFKIYAWIYSSGETIDKIGLTRNIISLHLNSNVQATFTGNPYFSIISGFEIYIKDNVKQYIEIKNKLSDTIVNLSYKANTIVDSFASNFKRSILTFVTFFSSFVILKILSTDKEELGISWEASKLSYSFLLIVLVYFFFSLWELYVDKKRFVSNYNNLKERYGDLLVKQDINRILNNDKDHNDDLNHINKKRNAYSLIWIVLIFIFYFTIKILSNSASN